MSSLKSKQGIYAEKQERMNKREKVSVYRGMYIWTYGWMGDSDVRVIFALTASVFIKGKDEGLSRMRVRGN